MALSFETDTGSNFFLFFRGAVLVTYKESHRKWHRPFKCHFSVRDRSQCQTVRRTFIRRPVGGFPKKRANRIRMADQKAGSGRQFEWVIPRTTNWSEACNIPHNACCPLPISVGWKVFFPFSIFRCFRSEPLKSSIFWIYYVNSIQLYTTPIVGSSDFPERSETSEFERLTTGFIAAILKIQK